MRAVSRLILHRSKRPATCLYAMTGALLAIRRHYDVIGLFVLALVSGVGSGFIRDGIFIQHGPPLATQWACLLLLLSAVLPRLCFAITSLLCLSDALGLGCYAVVGVEHALNAQLPIVTALVGVVTACGGGCCAMSWSATNRSCQTGTALRARRLDWSKPLRCLS